MKARAHLVIHRVCRIGEQGSAPYWPRDMSVTHHIDHVTWVLHTILTTWHECYTPYWPHDISVTHHIDHMTWVLHTVLTTWHQCYTPYWPHDISVTHHIVIIRKNGGVWLRYHYLIIGKYVGVWLRYHYLTIRKNVGVWLRYHYLHFVLWTRARSKLGINPRDTPTPAHSATWLIYRLPIHAGLTGRKLYVHTNITWHKHNLNLLLYSW